MSLLNVTQILAMSSRMTAAQAATFNALKTGTYIQVFIDGAGNDVDITLLSNSINDTSNVTASDWSNDVEGDHTVSGNHQYTWTATRTKRPC